MKRFALSLIAALATASLSTAVSADGHSLKVGFVYVSPIGEAGWDLPARLGEEGG